MMAHQKGLRGKPYDPFGWTKERRAERALISEYEALVDGVLPRLTRSNSPLIADLLGLAETIRGFGPVKEASMRQASIRRQELLARLDGAPVRLGAAE